MLFYERLVVDMIDKGFELNPYNPCVENKMVGSNQIKIFWYMDDLKVSHADPKEVIKSME